MLRTSCCPKEGIVQRDLGPGLDEKNWAPNELGKKIQAGNIQQIVRLWWGMMRILIFPQSWWCNCGGTIKLGIQPATVQTYRSLQENVRFVCHCDQTVGISHQFIVKLKNTVLEVGTAATVLNGHPAKLQRPQFLELRFLRWNSEPSWVVFFPHVFFPQKSGDVPNKQSDCIKFQEFSIMCFHSWRWVCAGSTLARHFFGGWKSNKDCRTASFGSSTQRSKCRDPAETQIRSLESIRFGEIQHLKMARFRSVSMFLRSTPKKTKRIQTRSDISLLGSETSLSHRNWVQAC